MNRKYDVNDMKYAVLTVTDNQSVIKMFDWVMFSGDEFKNIESTYNGSEIAITIYDPDERNEFLDVHQVLSNSSEAKYIDILSEILEIRKEESSNGCD